MSAAVLNGARDEILVLECALSTRMPAGLDLVSCALRQRQTYPVIAVINDLYVQAGLSR